jgi:4-hydroxybenzoate polyprenyltransferase
VDRAFLAGRINAYERLVRLDKPVGALLLLWPTLWALWIASAGVPRYDVLVIFVAGTFLMRAGGCAFNEGADRNCDAHVERTRERPLARGEIRPAEALAVGAILSLIAFGFVLFLNRLAIQLAFVALAIAVSYPFLKRFFFMPQLGLGIAFGFGIPMAYAAIRNSVPWECWVLLAANVCYAFAYDTEYAMVDREDDRKLGLRTSAIALGRFDVAGVMASYGLMLALLAWTGVALRLGWPYYAGLAAAAAMMLWHYTLIRDRSREGCFKAFRHNNWVGLAIFAGIALNYYL